MNKEQISPEARKLRNDYQRQWRRRNPDKLRQYATNYWEKKAQQRQLSLFDAEPVKRRTADQLSILMPR